ncbi:signal peptidase I [Limnochorda pilosa]|uniref:Signal peptidase I n=1 Tax=Limnochorda pilosa TaxID=1555112 RepID=A0A0K2SG65_LIMPI|nr:signal peptidase I [Limnochorda pilosa]BAS26032.1 signal peptidase I [Limnochorda pilosa]
MTDPEESGQQGAYAEGRVRPSFVAEFVRAATGALILAFVIMTFVARAFTVEGPSMLPTLHTGERLVVERVTYLFRPPRRGEVVVFRYPLDPREYFVKRVVGIPGDRVAVRAGYLWVNGQKLEEQYVSARPLRSFPEVQVPEGRYFVMGDNRNNSEDSRDPRVGFVPKELIVGRAIWRYWPIQSLAVLTPPESLRTLP